jgi:hypothetical protein
MRDADLAMTTHAPINSGKWGCFAWFVLDVVSIAGLCVMIEILIIFIPSHFRSPFWRMRAGLDLNRENGFYPRVDLYGLQPSSDGVAQANQKAASYQLAAN